MESKKEIKFSIGFDMGPTLMPVPQFGRWVEELGYDGITLAVGGIGVATGYDPFSVMGQIAAVTERLLLSTTVYVIPLVHPLILAQQVSTIDVLSQGRVTLGIGVGGERPAQFRNLGIPVNERAARTNEAIDILKGLWTQPRFSYHGKIFNFDNVEANPVPVQKPHPPIWIGGRVGGFEPGPDDRPRFKSRTAAIRRAARVGDGWVPYLMTPEQYREGAQRVLAYKKEYGREDAPFTFAHTILWSVGDNYEDALDVAAAGNPFGGHRREFSARFDIVGTSKDCIKRVEAYIDAGVTHFIIKPYVASELILGQVERIARDIIPYFR